MRFTFILHDLQDPYSKKKIDNIKKYCSNTEVFGYDRNTIEGESLYEHSHSLGFTEHGKYFKRIPSILKSFFSLRKKIDKTDFIYCMNLQTLLIGWLYKITSRVKVELIYDVADVREIMIKDNLLGFFLRKFEKFLIKRTSLVVVAAPAYIDGYFKKIQQLHNTNYHIIENKIDEQPILKSDSSNLKDVISKSNTITIGYFGVIRCKHSLDLLIELAKKANGRIQIYLRGFFIDHLKNYEKIIYESQYIRHEGHFLSPDDLKSMYSKVDLSWVAIHHAKSNIMWSRTNRFYQSCYFLTPMITQRDTPDSDEVEKYRIGLTIDLLNKNKSLEKLLKLTSNQVFEWKKNFETVPQNVFKLTNEYQDLIAKLEAKS